MPALLRIPALQALAPWLALCSCWIAEPGLAHAECTERAVSTGITLAACVEGPRQFVRVSADLTATDVGLRVSRPSERGRALDTWLASVPGGVVAIPAGDFEFPSFSARGLTIGEGEAWPDASDDGSRAVLAFDAMGVALMAPAEAVVGAAPWMRSALSGVSVLSAGVPRACDGSGCDPMPRSAVGLSADGRQLIFVAVAGYRSPGDGVTDTELGALAAEAGAHDAIRVATGASSGLAAGASSLVPSEGAFRAAGPLLALVDRESGLRGDLVGVVERASDMSAQPSATLEITATDGRRVAMGGTLTSGAYFRFPLPSRTYVVRARLDGYRSPCRVCTVEAGRETWCSLFLTAGSGEETCDPPPRGIDAGAFPLADGGLDAGAPRSDAGMRMPRVSGGCAALGASSRPQLGALMAALGAMSLLRRRRRAR